MDSSRPATSRRNTPVTLNNDKWIRLKTRLVKMSAINGVHYNHSRFELRVYEINGFTNVLKATEDEVTKLLKVLNITDKTLVLELDGDE